MGGRHMDFALPSMSAFARIRSLSLKILSTLKSVLVQLGVRVEGAAGASAVDVSVGEEELGEVVERVCE
jgi:hypothetical protein